MSINIMDSYKKKPKTIVMTDGVNKIKIENYKGSVFVSIIKINWAEHIGDDQEFLEHYSEIQVGGFRLDYPLAEPFYNAKNFLRGENYPENNIEKICHIIRHQ